MRTTEQLQAALYENIAALSYEAAIEFQKPENHKNYDAATSSGGWPELLDRIVTVASILTATEDPDTYDSMEWYDMIDKLAESLVQYPDRSAEGWHDLIMLIFDDLKQKI